MQFTPLQARTHLFATSPTKFQIPAGKSRLNQPISAQNISADGISHENKEEGYGHRLLLYPRHAVALHASLSRTNTPSEPISIPDSRSDNLTWPQATSSSGVRCTIWDRFARAFAGGPHAAAVHSADIDWHNCCEELRALHSRNGLYAYVSLSQVCARVERTFRLQGGRLAYV